MRVRTDRLWDLSQPVVHDGPATVEYDPPVVTRTFRRAVDGYNAELVHLTTHMGTHVDAPFHFDDAGATVDELPLAACAAPAEFLDLRADVEPGEPIAVSALEPLLGPLQEGDFAVLVTGWGERRGTTEEFLRRWPYLDGDGARLLLDRGVGGVGIDTLSIGGPSGLETTEPAHVALLSACAVIVEDLRVPEELIGRRCLLTAFPVLLPGCSAAWTRAVAWELES